MYKYYQIIFDKYDIFLEFWECKKKHFRYNECVNMTFSYFISSSTSYDFYVQSSPSSVSYKCDKSKPFYGLIFKFINH